MPKSVTRPLSARLVLLAAAGALALSLVWAMIAAEARDIDGEPVKPASAPERVVPAAEAPAVPVAAQR